jgi:hypothetical protein
MCYYCAETCTDNGQDLIGGFDQMDLVCKYVLGDKKDKKGIWGIGDD